jgi:hypothetical protein
MATDTLNPQSIQADAALTPPQVLWLITQGVLLGGAIAWQSIVNPDAMRVLQNDAAGIQMAVAALLLVVANFASLLGGFWGLNRLRGQGKEVVRLVLLGSLSVGALVLLYLPALFVLLIGPSAMNIRTIMLQP